MCSRNSWTLYRRTVIQRDRQTEGQEFVWGAHNITPGDLEILIFKTTAIRGITAEEVNTGLTCEDSDDNKARSLTDGGHWKYKMDEESEERQPLMST